MEYVGVSYDDYILSEDYVLTCQDNEELQGE